MKNQKYSKKKNYSRKNMRGSKDKPAERFEEKDDNTSHKYNDVSWYAKNQQMLIDAASYSFNNALGTSIPWKSMFNDGAPTITLEYSGMLVDSTNGNRAVPGLYSFQFIPTIGVSNSSASPANLAAQNIYSYVRYMNSGAKNYDQADLMLYLMAMDSLYMVFNWMKRIYGYLRTYSQYNRYMPKVYAAADTINFNDFISQMADFRLYINQVAAKLSSYCVPAVMPLFIRHSWMCSNIYKDSDILKAQQYMFVPKYVYKYSETTSTYGGELIPTQLLSSTSLVTFSTLRNLVNGLIDAVAYSEDIGVMSGDILKAYGESKLFKLTPLDPEYIVEPVYNEEVLNQMHNSTTIVPINVTSGWKVTQNPDTGYLIFNPSGAPVTAHMDKLMLNMPWDSVTPANVMVGTRLSAITETPTGSVTNPVIRACGSEIVLANYVYSMYANGTLTSTDVSDRMIITDPSDTNNFGVPFNTIGLVSQFDWHPLYYIWMATGTPSHYRLLTMLGDVSNYTLLDGDDLDKLHYTAIMSEFNIPQIGSF